MKGIQNFVEGNLMSEKYLKRFPHKCSQLSAFPKSFNTAAKAFQPFVEKARRCIHSGTIRTAVKFLRSPIDRLNVVRVSKS